MDMDFDCGVILNCQPGIAGAGRQLFDPMLATASGRRGGSEQRGLGDNAFLPWQIGTVM
ncbi:MAG: altronate hydrolase [Burkholderiaceae bacterium]